MTVTYTLKVANARLGGFAKLLLRWRGSIYKLLYREMFIFISLYFFLSILYRCILNKKQRRVFEQVCLYCETFTNLIPLSFVLGFYVAIVVGRWWQQYLAIPWPDRLMLCIATYIHGADENGRMIRRTLVRYLILMSVLTWQCMSLAVKKRFPTIEHLVEAGIMTEEEKKMYEEIPAHHGKWWLPANWFCALTATARKEGRIKDDILFKTIIDEMNTFRGSCGLLYSYDWISIPLVYTQVVTLAIYTFFLATLFGRQYLDPEQAYPNHQVDLYIPIFTILQFFFYMGWLKVAEQLINPFGEDDDDFELNWCLDRNIQVTLLTVDELYMKHPKLVKDLFWNDLEPQIPYTKSSVNFKTSPYLGSTFNLNIEPTDMEFVPQMQTIFEEQNLKNSYIIPSPTSVYNFNPQDIIKGFDTLKVPDNSNKKTILECQGSKVFNKIFTETLPSPKLTASKGILGSLRSLRTVKVHENEQQNLNLQTSKLHELLQCPKFNQNTNPLEALSTNMSDFVLYSPKPLRKNNTVHHITETKAATTPSSMESLSGLRTPTSCGSSPVNSSVSVVITLAEDTYSICDDSDQALSPEESLQIESNQSTVSSMAELLKNAHHG